MAKETMEIVNLCGPDDDATEDFRPEIKNNKKPPNDKQKKIKSLKEKICNLNGNIENLNQELVYFKEKLKYSEQYMDDSDDKMKDLEQQIELLEEQLILYKQNEDDHTANENELKEAVKQLQEMLNVASDHDEQRQMELDENKNTITLLRRENETLNQQIKAMNNYGNNKIELMVIENDNNYPNLQDKINDLEDRFNQLKDVKDLPRKCCKQQLQELNAEMDRLRERIAAMEREQKVLRENINYEQSMIASLQLQLNSKDNDLKMEQERRRLQSNQAVIFHQLASKFDEENLNLRRQIDKLKTDIRLQLVNHFSESKAQAESNEALQKNWEQKYLSDSQELARCKNELNKCQIKIKILEREINEFQKEKDFLAGEQMCTCVN